MREVPAARLGDSPTLGVVAICYNEEQDLPGFLEHLIPWVDEIVLVDDGSSDATRDIALKAGPKVRFLETPRGPGEYFAHQRNKGIAASTSDWLLHMDVDERVPPDMAQEIQSAVREPSKRAYYMRRINYFMHRPMRGGGWDRWRQVHLARRDALRFEGMFHETCMVDAAAHEIGEIRTRILHFNDRSFEHRLRKSSQYLEEVVAEVEARRSGPVSALDLVLRPAAEFAKKYVVQAGFRDGAAGLIAALHGATSIFRAYAIVWERQNRIPREALEQSFREQWRRKG